MQESKNFSTNYLTQFSVHLDEIWSPVEACWSDEPHIQFILSEQYSSQVISFLQKTLMFG